MLFPGNKQEVSMIDRSFNYRYGIPFTPDNRL